MKWLIFYSQANEMVFRKLKLKERESSNKMRSFRSVDLYKMNFLSSEKRSKAKSVWTQKANY